MTIGIVRSTVVLGTVLTVAGGASAETFTPTSSERTSSATVTASCEGTTSQTDSAVGFDPFQSYTDVVQECDGGATSVRAASLQQTQIYPQGFLGWNVAFAAGDSTTPFTTEASSDTELGFDVPEPSRIIVYAQLDIIFSAGAPGSLSADVEVTTASGDPVLAGGLMGIGVLESELFSGAALINAGSYVFRATARAGNAVPGTALPQGEVDNSHWFEVLRQGDTNSDERVDIDDLVNVVLGWGVCDPAYPCYADVNNDGILDIDDIVFIVTRWGP